MRIQVTVTLDVDPEAWTLAYGVEGASEIRADVKQHVSSSVVEHFTEMGMLR